MIEPTSQRAAEISAEEVRDYEGLFDRWADFYERTQYGKTLIKGAHVPYVVSRQGASNFYVMPHFDELSLLQWVVFVRYLKDVPGGRHRHQGGIALFGLDGHGYSIVNDERLDWGAGDVVMLPLVPNGLDHQHFAVEGEAATFMGIIYEPLIVAVGAEMTQLEPQDGDAAEEPPDMGSGRGRATGPIEPTLGGLLDLRERQRSELRLPKLIRGADLAVDDTRFGKLKWYLHPGKEGFAGTSPMLVFTSHLGSGESTDRLTTPGSGFMYVLEGSAQIGVDRELHDVVASDMVCLPSRRNGVSTHIDAGPDGVTVLVAHANLSGLGGVAMGADFSLAPRPTTGENS